MTHCRHLGNAPIMNKTTMGIEFLSLFFEYFFKDRKTDKLGGNIILFLISA